MLDSDGWIMMIFKLLLIIGFIWFLFYLSKCKNVQYKSKGVYSLKLIPYYSTKSRELCIFTYIKVPKQQRT